MLLHVAIALLGLISSVFLPPGTATSVTLLFATTSFASLVRLALVRSDITSTGKILALAIPALMWLWYFSPAALYSLNFFTVPNILLFDEHYTVRSMALMSAFFALFLLGIEIVQSRASRHSKSFNNCDLGYIELLNRVGLLAFFIITTGVGVMAYMLRPQMFHLDEVENFLDIYNDSSANAEASTFSSIIIVWGICLSILVRNSIFGSSFLWLVSAIPGLLALVAGTAATGRRQSIVFAAVVILFPALCRINRKSIVPLTLSLGAVLGSLVSIELLRTSGSGGISNVEAKDLIERPLGNFAGTTSFHARSMFYYESVGYLWGRSYLLNPSPMIPMSSRLFGPTQLFFYNEAPVVATVDFAQTRFFTMGGSMFSELHANFGIFGLIISVLAGACYGHWALWAQRAQTSLLRSVVAACLLLFFVWHIRTSLQGSVGMFRFIIVGAALCWSATFFGLTKKEAANSTSSIQGSPTA